MTFPSRRSTARAGAVTVAAVAGCAALSAYAALPVQRGLGAAYGAFIGLVLAVGVVAYLPLASRLGRLTAVAALSVVCASFLGGAAALSPTCPGTASRCPSGEVGAWMLSGALLPTMWALLLLPAAAAVRLAGKTGRRGWNRLRAIPATPAPPAAESAVPRSTKPVPRKNRGTGRRKNAGKTARRNAAAK